MARARRRGQPPMIERPYRPPDQPGSGTYGCDRLDAPSRAASEGPPIMGGYRLEGPKAARMYEVILPKKLGYFGKVEEVLEDLFREEAIRAIPFVQKSIKRNRKQRKDFDEEAWI